MTAGYIRQAEANIQAGLEINAEDLNTEFNRLQTVFDNTSGHDHSGSVTGDGQKIPLDSAVTGVLATTNGGTGNALGKQQITIRTVTETGSQTITTADSVIYWAPATPAAVTFNLPLSPTAGDMYAFKYNVGYGEVHYMKIVPPSGHTIEGRSNIIVLAQDSCVAIIYAGSNTWIIV